MDKSYELDNFDSVLAEFTNADLKYVNIHIFNPHLLEKILYANLPLEELGDMYRDLFNSAFKKEKPKYDENKMILTDTMRIYNTKSSANKKKP